MLVRGSYLDLSIALCTIIPVGTSLYLATQDKTEAASNILLSSMTITLMLLAFHGDGLRDEAMLAFPGIIIVSAMVGRPYLTSSLLFACGTYIVFLGGAYELNLLPEPAPKTTFYTAIYMTTIIVVISLAILALHRDLLDLLVDLNSENKRVKESSDQVKYLAHHDALTKLPNRVLACDRFEHALEVAKRENQSLAFLFLDLDNFKTINDTMGHSVGDVFLQEIAKRLNEVIRSSDTVARLGGDEFLLLIEQANTELDISAIAAKVLAEVTKPFHYNNQDFTISASIGISWAPKDGDTFEELMKKADMAMYQAKDLGKNTYHYFDVEQQKVLERQMSIIQQIKYGLDNDEFSLLFQPQICLKSNKVIGAEALIRWDNELHGQVSPEEFIPLAEHSILIHDIGDFVIEKSCLAAKQILASGASDFKISINVSVAQFTSELFIHNLKAKLEDYELPTSMFDIEITETLLVNYVDLIKSNLEQLKALGLSISIDDFGTGYSNLGYLKTFDVDTLKIDRTFIAGLPQNANNQTIVKAILQLARGLDMSVVAEGVSNQQTAELLNQWDCEVGQGFYWDRALPLDAFVIQLQDQCYLNVVAELPT